MHAREREGRTSIPEYFIRAVFGTWTAAVPRGPYLSKFVWTGEVLVDMNAHMGRGYWIANRVHIYLTKQKVLNWHLTCVNKPLNVGELWCVVRLLFPALYVSSVWSRSFVSLVQEYSMWTCGTHTFRLHEKAVEEYTLKHDSLYRLIDNCQLV